MNIKSLLEESRVRVKEISKVNTMESTKPSARAKKHGMWLLIWLWLMLAANVIAAIANLGAAFATTASPLQAVADITPMWALVLLGLFGIVNIVAAIALMKWKLWGFYAVVGVAVVAFVINLIIGLDIIRSLMGFIGPIILYFLMKPKWNMFS